MRAPLAGVDASWLRLDEPANRMIVTGVLVLAEPVQPERLRQLLEQRLLPFERFRRRVARWPPGLGLPCWEDDPDFALDRHLVEAPPAAAAGEGALQGFVSELLAQPLPPDRPLWRIHFLPRYQGGSALVVRIHHCIADGLALVHVLLSLADGAPEVAAAAPPAPRAWRRPLAPLSAPVHLLRAGLDAGRLLPSLARLLLLPPDPPTRLKGSLSVAKRVAWSRPFRLDDFKRVGRATGCTVNDVLVAALAGGLRRYLLAGGEVTRGLDVRGVVPVNLRRPGEERRLGNRFGLLLVPLPLGLEDPLGRLLEVRRRIQAVKGSPEAVAVYALLWAAGFAPRPIFDLALGAFAARATAVVTNVVGPRAPIAIAGSRLRQAMFWVPSAGHLGLGVSLLSYAGSVWLAVQSDAGIVPDPGQIVEGFGEELGALLALAGGEAG